MAREAEAARAAERRRGRRAQPEVTRRLPEARGLGHFTERPEEPEAFRRQSQIQNARELPTLFTLLEEQDRAGRRKTERPTNTRPEELAAGPGQITAAEAARELESEEPEGQQPSELRRLQIAEPEAAAAAVVFRGGLFCQLLRRKV